MVRATLSLLAGGAALACCAQAYALSSTANISMTVTQPAGINISSTMVLPTVTTTTVTSSASAAAQASRVGTSGVASTTNSRTGATSGVTNPASPTGNATLTIRGQAGDAVSMAVPESFTVVRTGGTESLTVKTNTNLEYGLSGDGVVLGGTVMGGNTMSVNVGGAISLASAAQATPGAYEGLLVVVVQYN